MRPKVTLPSRDEAERDQERVAVMYTGGEAGIGDDYNPYGRHDVTSRDQAGHPPLDMVVMRAFTSKGAVAKPRKVEVWFEEFEPQLEETDFQWWP